MKYKDSYSAVPHRGNVPCVLQFFIKTNGTVKNGNM